MRGEDTALACFATVVVNRKPGRTSLNRPTRKMYCEVKGRPHHGSRSFVTIQWGLGGDLWVTAGQVRCHSTLGKEVQTHLAIWGSKPFGLGILLHSGITEAPECCFC